MRGRYQAIRLVSGSHLQSWLSAPRPLIVLEASGSYERLLTLSLSKAGIAFRLVNPRQEERGQEGMARN